MGGLDAIGHGLTVADFGASLNPMKARGKDTPPAGAWAAVDFGR